MRNNIQIAEDFSESINDLEGIVSIVLFGSVARGEDTLSSDVDVAVIHERKKESDLRKEINKLKTEEVQLTLLSVKELPRETEIVGALSGEGILLHGNPIPIKEKDIQLKPKILLSYSLTKLEQKDKVRVDRALYGYTSKSRHKGKTYTTTVKGLVEQPGIEKVNRGVILAERRKAQKVINVFKRFGLSYSEVPVWTY